MVSIRRKLKQMENQLIASLTEACETAESEIPGFSWLTHDNGNEEFPTGLRVTWIFDTEAARERALTNGDDERMRTLTRAALDGIGVDARLVTSCLQFDSEEACRKAQDGDWVARLAQLRRTHH
ncbi:hypothetical protein GCM10022278_21050 [Allohahella marinimesophila]|uniref:DUF3168 domain-containing protein n=2 Tax=Allohahella marinimesophila TaxID=1054972 RepID=A0ABP7PBM0_9GAMM